MEHSINHRFTYGFGFATIIILTSIWIINSTAFQYDERFLSIALTFDLTVFLPLVYFFFIRKTAMPKFTVIPIFILSIVLASAIIPSKHQGVLDIVKHLITPVELFVFGFIIFKIQKIYKDQKLSRNSQFDFSESLRKVLTQHVKHQSITNIFTTEISIFYYVFYGWGNRKEIDGRMPFTYHKDSRYFQVIGVFVFLIITETFVLHLALSNWNLAFAWISTSLSIYGLFFLIGDSNAIKKRPIYFDEQYLYLRIGIRWFSKIPLKEIESIELIMKAPEGKENANLILIGSPNILIKCTSEQNAIGYYGIYKSFKSVSIAIDDKKNLKNSLELELKKAHNNG